MAKRNEGLQDDYIRSPRGGYPDSQSPQTHRGSAQDFEQFGDRATHDTGNPNQRTDPANRHAWGNLDSLDIEKHNPR
jgi:hypothetical protein